MKFSAISQLAFAAAVLAAPQPKLRRDTTSPFAVAHREKMEARTPPRFQGSTHPAMDIGRHPASELSNETYADAYSSNWGGVVYESPPSGTFTSIVGTWNVPSLSPGSGSGPWYTAPWVGIDGWSCSSAILQAGTIGSVDSSGAQSVTFWVEWFPDAMNYVDSISASPGDTVTVSISSSSSTSGSITLENNSSGQSVTVDMTAPSGSDALCGSNAEWIVEDVSSGGLVPFAPFSEVYFTGCSAGLSDGSSVGVSGATVVDIVQNNEILASPTIVSDSEVDVVYG